LTVIETIGYGGKHPDEFFHDLSQLQPDLVIDVRDNPFKAFLSVYTLPHLKERLGERYIWLPSCGNATRKMPPTLRNEAACIERIKYLTSKHERVVLLCAEKDESRCHRSYIKAKVEEAPL